MRSGLGWTLNLVTGVLKKEGRMHRDTYRAESHVKMEAETK